MTMMTYWFCNSCSCPHLDQRSKQSHHLSFSLYLRVVHQEVIWVRTSPRAGEALCIDNSVFFW